jgi:membrane associated rhomboid family serine protease/Zn-finger nucleic acid-binding protein
MAHCPICTTSLRTVRQREGIYFQCDSCGGRAVTIPQIRRVAGDGFATGLLRQINSNQQFGTRACPFCNQRMRQFLSREPSMELDACKTCGAVWFDPSEFETVPESVLESANEARLRAAEALGRHRIQQQTERGVTTDLPDLDWKLVPLLFGFPVESEVDPLSRRPWFTWSLALVILFVSLMSFGNLDAVVKSGGFIPAEAFRYGGLTLISSFFLHGGYLHLLGNLYFLLVFGDNVEDYLGRARYGLLILASTLTGDFLYMMLHSGSTVPCVGASGGISGIIVFYALQFPRARLGFMFNVSLYVRWFQIPAWCALVLWFLLQFMDATFELYGFSNVAATAHLGGAAAGAALWWWWRSREQKMIS